MKDTMKGLVYDWSEFSLADGEADYDVKSGVAALFNNIPNAQNIAMFFNKEIGVRINSTVMPKMTFGISRSPFQSPEGFLEIKNLFLSNASGAICTVEVLLW